MDPTIDPNIARHAAGPLGAVSALFFMKGPWPQRLAMLVPGMALSYYGSYTVAHLAGMSEGLAGFLLGLFGMAAVAKVFETWEQLQLGELLGKWLAKLLRVGGKEGDA